MHRLLQFRRKAKRQLAHMTANRKRRAGEHSARCLRSGKLEEPGTGTNVWSKNDVTDYVTDQLRSTEDLLGECFCTGHEDENEIALALATRPDDRPMTESLVRQIAQGQAAGALEMAVRAASAPPPDNVVASFLIPELLTQYLRDCPSGEFAPTQYGSKEEPFTKMMALVFILFGVYRKVFNDLQVNNDKGVAPVVHDLQDLAGKKALAEFAGEVVKARWDGRRFVAARSATEGNLFTTMIWSECGCSKKDWLESLGAMKLDGLKKIHSVN